MIQILSYKIVWKYKNHAGSDITIYNDYLKRLYILSNIWYDHMFCFYECLLYLYDQITANIILLLFILKFCAILIG